MMPWLCLFVQPHTTRDPLNHSHIFLCFRDNFSLSLNTKNQFMLIERTNDEVIIRLPSYVDTEGLQRLIDYLSYKEATAKSKAKQSDVDKLAKEVKKGWWKKTVTDLLSENNRRHQYYFQWTT
jgi:hypothetical protein